MLCLLAPLAEATEEIDTPYIGIELGNKTGVLDIIDLTSGLYGSFKYDGNKYEHGNVVSICNDGGISGSVGSGTCSGHGGVSHTRKEQSKRAGFSIGYMWNPYGDLYAGGGVGFGAYLSEVNVGTEDENELYANFEAKVAYHITPKLITIVTYDNEVERFSAGVGFTF